MSIPAAYGDKTFTFGRRCCVRPVVTPAEGYAVFPEGASVRVAATDGYEVLTLWRRRATVWIGAPTRSTASLIQGARMPSSTTYGSEHLALGRRRLTNVSPKIIREQVANGYTVLPQPADVAACAQCGAEGNELTLSQLPALVIAVVSPASRLHCRHEFRICIPPHRRQF